MSVDTPDVAGLPDEAQMGDIEIGEVQWHCSENEGLPDVGVLLRLDASQYLWAGQITRADWEDAGPDAAALGDDFGWWAILYEENGGSKTVLGRFIDEDTARDFIDKMAWIIRQAESQLTQLREALTREREECANLAEDIQIEVPLWMQTLQGREDQARIAIAAAIRARSDKPGETR